MPELTFDLLYNHIRDANYTWATEEEAFGPDYVIVAWHYHGAFEMPYPRHKYDYVVSEDLYFPPPKRGNT
jgi:hypothetical protein